MNGKKISNFDDVPVFKDPTEMSLNVLEVHYKFSKFEYLKKRPSRKWMVMSQKHGPNGPDQFGFAQDCQLSRDHRLIKMLNFQYQK